jgi:hypothetical protein
MKSKKRLMRKVNLKLKDSKNNNVINLECIYYNSLKKENDLEIFIHFTNLEEENREKEKTIGNKIK